MKHVNDDRCGHSDARKQRCNACTVESHRGGAEISVNENPVQAHIEQHSGNHDPERHPRTQKRLAKVLRGGFRKGIGQEET